MDKTGPIIVVDDDTEECELVTFAYSKLGLSNKLLCFQSGKEVLAYLESKEQMPFLILSDVHMPQMTGLELLEHINTDSALSNKRIPFIFLSTTASPKDITSAFQLKAQGVFQKGSSVQQIADTLKIIIGYWKEGKYIDEQ